MGKLRAIVGREYFERVRTRWFVIATVFGPLFFAAIIILPAVLTARSKASEDLANMIVIDATGTDLGARVADALGGVRLGGGARPRVRVIPPMQLTPAETVATHEVMRGEVRGYLVLDDGTVAGEAARYAGRNASSLADMGTIQSAVRRTVLALRLEREGLDPARVGDLTTMDVALSTERITDRGRSGSGLVNVAFGLAAAFLLYMMIVLYGQNVLRGVLEEKMTRVAEVVVSSVSPHTLLAGKVLGVGAVGLTQQVIWFAAAVALFELRAPLLARLGAPTLPLQLPSITPGVAAILLLLFLLGYTFYAALFAAVGAMVNSDQDAQQAAMPVMLLLTATIIVVQPIMMNPTGRLATIMSWLPFSAPVIMPLRLSVAPVPPLEIAGTIAILMLACAAAVWVAARIYRVGLLMYGKRPSVRELAHWVREAR